MDRRRSPVEVETRAEITSSVTCTCSESAIFASLAEVELVSRGLNLNLEQRDAKGSMILRGAHQLRTVKWRRSNGPCNVVAHKTKAGNPCICLHDTTQGTLSILGHGISLIEDDYLIRWARVGFPIRCHDLCPGCLPSKVLNFLPDNTDSTFIGCIQFQNAGFEVVWTEQLPCEGKNGRGFPGAWRTIEEHVWKLSPGESVLV